MKFLAYVGLIFGASAIRMTQHQPVPVSHHMVLANAMRDIELTPAQKEEIKAWTEAELKDGGDITKQEAWDALLAFCEKHGFEKPTPEEKAWLEKQFDRADKNGNGAIDKKEFDAAMRHVEKHGIDLKAVP